MFEDFRENRGSAVLIGVGIFLAFFVVLNVVAYVWYPAFMPWFEQRQSGEEVLSDNYDADKAVQEYEWFRQQHHDIEAQRRQIENHYEEDRQFHKTYGNDSENWSRQAETRHNRIHQRITGNQNQLEQMVADYNARSDMANRAVFKCHLPYKVDESFAIHGPPGSGDAEQPQDVNSDGEVVTGSPPPAEQCDGLPKKHRS